MKAEIYGAPWCTFCKQAIRLCEANEIPYDYLNVDDEATLKTLEERMGSKVKTIPQIFLDGKFIPGGFTGLKQELSKS